MTHSDPDPADWRTAAWPGAGTPDPAADQRRRPGYDSRRQATSSGDAITSTGSHRAVKTPFNEDSDVTATGSHRAVRADYADGSDLTSTGSHRAVRAASFGESDLTSTGSHRAVKVDSGPPPESAGTDRRIPRQTRRQRQLSDRLPQQYRDSIPERPGLRQVWANPSRARTVVRPALSRHALAGVLVLLAFAGGAEVIFLWWLQTPATRLQTQADDYIMFAQLTGLLAGYLLLIEIALMARIPWLERRIGSWLAIMHRGLGGYLVMLIAAHVTFVIVGYSTSLKVPASTVVKVIFSTYPYVLLATGAYAMLLAIGLSSIRGIRRKLGYDAWHSLHLIAYPAAFMAFFHQIFLGAQFTRNEIAKDTWIGMHLTVAAAIIAYRLVIPLNRTWRHRLRVVGVVIESADTISIYVGGVNIDKIGAQAGQYFRWRFVGRGLWYQTHPFSLSAAPNEDCLRLTVKGVGNYTRRLKRRIRPGIRVVADGPYGAFTSELRRRHRVLLVGGGVGVTPLRAIAESMAGSPGDIVFIQRASAIGDLLMVDELEQMHAQRRIVYLPVFGKRGSTPRHDPLAPNRLRELVPDLADREVFVCGSPGMARSTIKSLRRAGVSWHRIHSELFDF